MSGEGETIYRAVLTLGATADVEIPAVTVMVRERPGGGWTGVAHIDARYADARSAFALALRDGLLPGYSVNVQLKFAEGSRYEQIVVRSWPSMVGMVASRYWPKNTSSDGSARKALVAIGFRDPVSYFRAYPTWNAFAQCSPAAMLGAILSQASGGDGKPTRTPAIEHFTSTVNMYEKLTENTQKTPYAIACGEPLGYWVARVMGQLGIEIGIYGDSAGHLNIELSDGEVADAEINEDDGIWMTVNPRRDPSGINMVPAGQITDAKGPDRGTLLDDIEHGGPKRFGASGPIERVMMSDGFPTEEAERQTGAGRDRDTLAQVRIAMRSRQPGFMPRRLLKIGLDPNFINSEGTESIGEDHFLTLFGANEWQICDVAHIYSYGSYWNRAGIMKLSSKATPFIPPSDGVKMVPGVVDDGVSETGNPVERDRLGRIPVQFPFYFEKTETQAALSAEPWPHRLKLGCAELGGAGHIHGFMRAHRQKDWCRIAVSDPLYAEVAGFSYRDDREVHDSVEQATMALAIKQGADEWRGVLFEPSTPEQEEDDEQVEKSSE